MLLHVFSLILLIANYLILFNDRCHPKEMKAKEIEAFLTHLAVKENVSASTQNQALDDLHSRT
jgi:hypothetical protein